MNIDSERYSHSIEAFKVDFVVVPHAASSENIAHDARLNVSSFIVSHMRFMQTFVKLMVDFPRP